MIFLIYNKDIFILRRADNGGIFMSLLLGEDLVKEYDKRRNEQLGVKDESTGPKLSTWSYVNKMDALYDKYSIDRNFSADMWQQAMKYGSQENYFIALEGAKGAQLSDKFYDDRYEFDTRMLELYAEQADDTKKSERFKDVWDPVNQDYVKTSLGEMTDKEFYKWQVGELYAYEDIQFKKAEEQRQKEALGWWGQFGNDILATFAELGEGALSIVTGVVDFAVAVGSLGIVPWAANGGGDYGEAFVNYFGEHGLTALEQNTVRAALDEYERTHTHFKDIDGNMTDVGKWFAGSANSIGMMIPAIVVSACTSGIGRGVLGSVAFYTGIFSKNMYDVDNNPLTSGSPAWLKIVNTTTKTAAEAVIEVALGKLMGGTISNTLMGIGGRFNASAVKAIGQNIKTAGVKYLAKSALQEGLEEFIQDFSTNLVDQFSHLIMQGYGNSKTYISADGTKKNGKITDYSNNGVTFQTLVDSFFMGALCSIVISGAGVPMSAIKSGIINRKAKKNGKYNTDLGFGPGDVIIEVDGKPKKLRGFTKMAFADVLSELSKEVNGLAKNKFTKDKDFKKAKEVYTALMTLSEFYGSFSKERLENCETLLGRVIQAEKRSTVQGRYDMYATTVSEPTSDEFSNIERTEYTQREHERIDANIENFDKDFAKVKEEHNRVAKELRESKITIEQAREQNTKIDNEFNEKYGSFSRDVSRDRQVSEVAATADNTIEKEQNKYYDTLKEVYRMNYVSSLITTFSDMTGGKYLKKIKPSVKDNEEELKEAGVTDLKAVQAKTEQKTEQKINAENINKEFYEKMDEKGISLKAKDKLEELAEEFDLVIATDGNFSVEDKDNNILYVPVAWLENYETSEIYKVLEQTKIVDSIVKSKKEHISSFRTDLLEIAKKLEKESKHKLRGRKKPLTKTDAVMEFLFNRSVFQYFILSKDADGNMLIDKHQKFLSDFYTTIEKGIKKSTWYNQLYGGKISPRREGIANKILSEIKKSIQIPIMKAICNFNMDREAFNASHILEKEQKEFIDKFDRERQLKRDFINKGIAPSAYKATKEEVIDFYEARGMYDIVDFLSREKDNKYDRLTESAILRMSTHHHIHGEIHTKDDRLNKDILTSRFDKMKRIKRKYTALLRCLYFMLQNEGAVFSLADFSDALDNVEAVANEKTMYKVLETMLKFLIHIPGIDVDAKNLMARLKTSDDIRALSVDLIEMDGLSAIDEYSNKLQRQLNNVGMDYKSPIMLLPDTLFKFAPEDAVIIDEIYKEFEREFGAKPEDILEYENTPTHELFPDLYWKILETPKNEDTSELFYELHTLQMQNHPSAKWREYKLEHQYRLEDLYNSNEREKRPLGVSVNSEFCMRNWFEERLPDKFVCIVTSDKSEFGRKFKILKKVVFEDALKKDVSLSVIRQRLLDGEVIYSKDIFNFEDTDINIPIANAPGIKNGWYSSVRDEIEVDAEYFDEEYFFDLIIHELNHGILEHLGQLDTLNNIDANKLSISFLHFVVEKHAELFKALLVKEFPMCNKIPIKRMKNLVKKYNVDIVDELENLFKNDNINRVFFWEVAEYISSICEYMFYYLSEVELSADMHRHNKDYTINGYTVYGDSIYTPDGDRFDIDTSTHFIHQSERTKRIEGKKKYMGLSESIIKSKYLNDLYGVEDKFRKSVRKGEEKKSSNYDRLNAFFLLQNAEEKMLHNNTQPDVNILGIDKQYDRISRMEKEMNDKVSYLKQSIDTLDDDTIRKLCEELFYAANDIASINVRSYKNMLWSEYIVDEDGAAIAVEYKLKDRVRYILNNIDKLFKPVFDEIKHVKKVFNEAYSDRSKSFVVPVLENTFSNIAMSDAEKIEITVIANDIKREYGIDIFADGGINIKTLSNDVKSKIISDAKAYSMNNVSSSRDLALFLQRVIDSKLGSDYMTAMRHSDDVDTSKLTDTQREFYLLMKKGYSKLTKDEFNWLFELAARITVVEFAKDDTLDIPDSLRDRLRKHYEEQTFDVIEKESPFYHRATLNMFLSEMLAKRDAYLYRLQVVKKIKAKLLFRDDVDIKTIFNTLSTGGKVKLSSILKIPLDTDVKIIRNDAFPAIAAYLPDVDKIVVNFHQLRDASDNILAQFENSIIHEINHVIQHEFFLINGTNIKDDISDEMLKHVFQHHKVLLDWCCDHVFGINRFKNFESRTLEMIKSANFILYKLCGGELYADFSQHNISNLNGYEYDLTKDIMYTPDGQSFLHPFTSKKNDHTPEDDYIDNLYFYQYTLDNTSKNKLEPDFYTDTDYVYQLEEVLGAQKRGDTHDNFNYALSINEDTVELCEMILSEQVDWTAGVVTIDDVIKNPEYLNEEVREMCENDLSEGNVYYRLREYYESLEIGVSIDRYVNKKGERKYSFVSTYAFDDVLRNDIKEKRNNTQDYSLSRSNMPKDKDDWLYKTIGDFYDEDILDELGIPPFVPVIFGNNVSTSFVNNEKVGTAIFVRANGNINNREFVNRLNHEFRHLCQFLSRLETGFTKDFEVSKELLRDVKKYIPELFENENLIKMAKNSGYVRNGEQTVEEWLVTELVYRLTGGELQAYGIISTLLFSKPIYVDRDDSGRTYIFMPWYDAKTGKGKYQVKVLASNLDEDVDVNTTKDAEVGVKIKTEAEIKAVAEIEAKVNKRRLELMQDLILNDEVFKKYRNSSPEQVNKEIRALQKKKVPTVEDQAKINELEHVKEVFDNVQLKLKDYETSLTQKGNHYSGRLYHGSTTALENVDYDVTKGKGLKNLGPGLYFTPNFDQAYKHGKHVATVDADYDNILMLTEDMSFNVDDLYYALGIDKPDNVDWDTVKKDLGKIKQDKVLGENFVKRIQERGYKGIYTIGYGYADKSIAQLVVYDRAYQKGITTELYDDNDDTSTKKSTEKKSTKKEKSTEKKPTEIITIPKTEKDILIDKIVSLEVDRDLSRVNERYEELVEKLGELERKKSKKAKKGEQLGPINQKRYDSLQAERKYIEKAVEQAKKKRVALREKSLSELKDIYAETYLKSKNLTRASIEDTIFLDYYQRLVDNIENDSIRLAVDDGDIEGRIRTSEKNIQKAKTKESRKNIESKIEILKKALEIRNDIDRKAKEYRKELTNKTLEELISLSNDINIDELKSRGIPLPQIDKITISKRRSVNKRYADGTNLEIYTKEYVGRQLQMVPEIAELIKATTGKEEYFPPEFIKAIKDRNLNWQTFAKWFRELDLNTLSQEAFDIINECVFKNNYIQSPRELKELLSNKPAYYWAVGIILAKKGILLEDIVEKNDLNTFLSKLEEDRFGGIKNEINELARTFTYIVDYSADKDMYGNRPTLDITPDIEKSTEDYARLSFMFFFDGSIAGAVYSANNFRYVLKTFVEEKRRRENKNVSLSGTTNENRSGDWADKETSLEDQIDTESGKLSEAESVGNSILALYNKEIDKKEADMIKDVVNHKLRILQKAALNNFVKRFKIDVSRLSKKLGKLFTMEPDDAVREAEDLYDMAIASHRDKDAKILRIIIDDYISVIDNQITDFAQKVARTDRATLVKLYTQVVGTNVVDGGTVNQTVDTVEKIEEQENLNRINIVANSKSYAKQIIEFVDNGMIDFISLPQEVRDLFKEVTVDGKKTYVLDDSTYKVGEIRTLPDEVKLIVTHTYVNGEARHVLGSGHNYSKLSNNTQDMFEQIKKDGRNVWVLKKSAYVKTVISDVKYDIGGLTYIPKHDLDKKKSRKKSVNVIYDKMQMLREMANILKRAKKLQQENILAMTKALEEVSNEAKDLLALKDALDKSEATQREKNNAEVEKYKNTLKESSNILQDQISKESSAMKTGDRPHTHEVVITKKRRDYERTDTPNNFVIGSVAEMPAVLQEIFDVSFNEFADTKVQFASKDKQGNLYNKDKDGEKFDSIDKHEVNNWFAFYDAVHDKLSALTRADVDRILDFFRAGITISLNAPIGKLQAFTVFLLGYIVDTARKHQARWMFTDAEISMLEESYENLANIYGSGLNAVGQMKDVINPFRRIEQRYFEDFNIPANILDDFFKTADLVSNAPTQQGRDNALVHMYHVMKTIEKQMGDTWLQKRGWGKRAWSKTSAFRYMAMLSSPFTWMRNLTTNIIMTGFNSFADTIGSKGLLGKKKYREDLGQINLANIKVSTDVAKFVQENFLGKEGVFADVLKSFGTKYDLDASKFVKKGRKSEEKQLIVQIIAAAMENKFAAENKWDNKIMQGAQKFVNFMISDQAFIKMAFRKYVGKMIQIGVDNGTINLAQGLSNEVLNCFAEAIIMANFDYMHKGNAMSKMLGSLKSTHPGAYEAVQILFPFVSSGMNWFLEGLKYTPIGLVGTIIKWARLEKEIAKITEKRYNGEKIPDSRFTEYLIRRDFGKGMIGMVLSIAGLMLGMFGIIRLDDDDDKLYLYAGDNIKVDVTNIFASSSILFGASIGQIFTGKLDSFDKIMSQVTTSMLSGFFLFETLESFEYADDDWGRSTTIFENYLKSFVPQLWQFVIRCTNDKKIKYSAGFAGLWERWLNSFIPTQPLGQKKVNIYTGKEQTKYFIPFFGELFKSGIVFGMKAEISNPSDTELFAADYDINKNELTGELSINGKKYKINQTAVNKYYGQLNSKSLLELENQSHYVQLDDGTYATRHWSKLTDKERKRVITRTMNKNAEYAKIFVWTQSGGKYYASDADFIKLRQLGITKNVYRGDKGFVR